MRKPRQVRTIRRTKAQMEVDRINFKYEQCKVCDVPLKTVANKRNTAKMCEDCRGYGDSKPYIRKLHIDLLKQNIEPCEDEMFFEDNPIAVAETTPGSPTEEVGRVVRALPEVAFGMSGLSEIMDTSSHHYRFKHGSAFDGVRYTYEKKKETNN